MLVSYIDKYRKIVMGLLSYIDDFKDIDNLNQEMKRIDSGQRKIYLWKDEETDNYVGLIGFDEPEDSATLLIRYLSINPSFRKEGLSYKMMTALANEFPDKRLTGTLDMAEFMNKWALHEQRTQPHIVKPEDDEEDD